MMKRALLLSCALLLPAAAHGGQFTVDQQAGTARRGQYPWQLSGAPQIMPWAAATSYCAGLGAGWRLPTRTELEAIAVYLAKQQNPVPEIPTESYYYWTSTEGGEGAYNVDFWTGDADDDLKTTRRYARCVRTQ